MEMLGDLLGGGAPLVGAAQELPHTLHQQAVAPVLEHGQGQGALQHGAQGGFVAADGQGQVAGVEAETGGVGVELHRAGEEQGIGLGVGRWGEGKARLLQGNA